LMGPSLKPSTEGEQDCMRGQQQGGGLI
jgi:hypothetical protein